MINLFYLLLFCLSPHLVFTQEERIVIDRHSFTIVTSVVGNEWNSTDTLKTLYRIKEGQKERILDFYPYMDEGSDCNNRFWSKESFEVMDDSIQFLTHYFQETGIDPIPEWRKQIYTVNDQGQLNLIYDYYKYYNSNDWVKE